MGFTGFLFTPIHGLTSYGYIYIYTYNCCLGPQLVHCCTVVPSLRQPGCLHILVNFNVLRVSMVTVLMLNFVRAGSTRGRSVENTIGYSWNKLWRLRVERSTKWYHGQQQKWGHPKKHLKSWRLLVGEPSKQKQTKKITHHQTKQGWLYGREF